MRIAMIGTGYVGLVSGTCFADFGHTVVCVDKDVRKIERLHSGKVPIYEQGLEDLVAHNVAARRLSFSTRIEDAVPAADAVFIAVGTPARPGDGHADLTHVHAAAREVAANITGYTVIVNKSTVPVGTGAEVERVMRAGRPDGDFDVVSNPEFLREGAAVKDFLEPDRVVVGTDSERAREVMARVYKTLDTDGRTILFTSRATAELIKYAANAFLATKVTFINEVSNLCERVGADVLDVALGIGLDTRIGNRFLQPGPGFGGSCFPKDTRALAATARACDAPVTIVEAVIAANEDRKRQMADKIIAACDGAEGRTIAILGLTFKAKTDDIRDAPSLVIIPALQRAGAQVRVFDPEGMEQARALISGVTWCADAEEAMTGADAAAIITEWPEFAALDPAMVRRTLNTPLLIDLRNLYNPLEMAAEGIRYVSVGRAMGVPVAARVVVNG